MMNNIKVISNIKEEDLDNVYYYESLVEYAVNEGLINELQISTLKLQELNLINIYITKMTGGSTTSINRKVAEEIMKSNSFNISYYLRNLNNPDKALDEIINRSLLDILKDGNNLINNDLKKYKFYINYVISNMLDIKNYAYQNTLKKDVYNALKEYNKDYDAHNKIITAEYETLKFPNTIGLTFLIDYMKYFNFENLFLSKFNVDDINNLLQRRTRDYISILINPCEEVLIMSTCLKILNKDYLNLSIDSVEIELLYLKLIELNDDEIRDLIYQSITKILKEIDTSNETNKYILENMIKIENRIINSLRSDTLDKLLGINEIN